MLKIGYALILAAGVGLIGFAGYQLVVFLIRAPEIHMFFKVLILCAAAGIILTLAGLVMERRKEGNHVSRDDESN